MTKKRKKALIALVLFGGILLIFIGAVEYTSHSKFCSSCHYMKPYFRSWESSSHSQFECSVCHYAPGGGIQSKLRKKIEGLVMVGRYWTKLYVKSKPWAEIRDESCLREGCHERRLLEGKVRFNKVVFDHKIHFSDLKRGKQLQCTSCHSQIVQGEHITVTESSCFICHFKQSEFYPRIAECTHCHRKENLVSEEISRYNHSLVFEKEFACHKCHSNVIMGDGAVPRENCYKCHGERNRLEQYGDTDLMHTAHIFMNKIECNQCHLDIQHKIIKDIETIADCSTCHTDFHEAQKILYAGEGGKGIAPSMPNVMLEKGLSCKGCHIFHEESGGKLIKSDTYVSKGQACESCHGSGFSRLLKDWEISIAKKLAQIQVILSQTRREIEASTGAEKEKALGLMEEAVFNIELVKRGKSVHNMAYSQALLSAAYDMMVSSLGIIGSPYQPPVFISKAENIPTECSNCHAGIEEIGTRIFGLNFSHKNHLTAQKIDCSRCHSNVRTHGEFIASKQSCATCHHKETARSCETCHSLQAAFYQGGQVLGRSIPKDMMAEAEVKCVDCHLDENGQIDRSSQVQCIGCHSEGYGELFAEWQDRIRSLNNSLRSRLNQKKKQHLAPNERAEIEAIERFCDNVDLDGSSGIHNYLYIEETLTSLKEKIK